MKILNLIFAFLLATSCQTESVVPDSNLVGEWQWVKSEGGFAGMTITATATDQKKIVISQSGEYKYYENNVLKQNNTFSVSTVNSNASGKQENYLKFNAPGYPNVFYEVFGTKLILKEDISDGFTHFYNKM